MIIEFFFQVVNFADRLLEIGLLVLVLLWICETNVVGAESQTVAVAVSFRQKFQVMFGRRYK